MYVFEYLVYHLKPYGISTNLIVPANQSYVASHTSASESNTLIKLKDSAKVKEPKTASSLMKETHQTYAGSPSIQGDGDMQKKEKLKYKKSNREGNEVLSEVWNSKSNEKHATKIPNQVQRKQRSLGEANTRGNVKLEAYLGAKSSTTIPSLTNYSKRHPRVKHKKWVPRIDVDR